MESWNKSEQASPVLEFDELVRRSRSARGVRQFRISEAYYAARDFERVR
jgi:hypothetical protein